MHMAAMRETAGKCRVTIPIAACSQRCRLFYMTALANVAITQSMLREIMHLACWQDNTPRSVIDLCCGPTQTKAHCFTGRLTKERCCNELDQPYMLGLTGPDSGAAANRAATPLKGEAPWVLDDACAAEWIDEDAGEKQARALIEGSGPSYCRRMAGEPWVTWTGFAVQLQQLMIPGFEVADLSECMWGIPDCMERMSRTWVTVEGRTWVPPRGTTAVLVLKTHDRGGSIQVVPVLKRSKRPMKVETQRLRPRRGPDLSAAVPLARPSVYVLTLDATSRSLFRTAMPKTYEFVTGESASGSRGAPAPAETPPMPASHEAFAFSRYHTLNNGGTLASMFPFLFGGLRFPCSKTTLEMVANGLHHLYNTSAALRACSAFPNGGALGELRRAGYRLGLSYTQLALGSIVMDTVPWDHVMPHIVDGMRDLYSSASGIEEPLDNIDFVCAGRERMHRLLLDWNAAVLDLYRGEEPAFVFSHLAAAHANTWSVSAMDVSVRDHLKETLEKNPDLMIVLISDHGLVTVPCDQKAPILHILAPRSLLEREPRVAAALAANRREIVSSLDLFSTLRHLAGLDPLADWAGFGWLRKGGVLKLLAAPTKAYQEHHILDLTDTSLRPRSLFTPLPRNRSCVAAGITREHCAPRLGIAVREVTLCKMHAQLSEVTKRELSRVQADLAKEPLSEDRQIICDTASDLFGWQVVTQINALNGDNTCQRFTFGGIERIEDEGSISASRRFRLRIATLEGSPPRVFDVSVSIPNLAKTLYLSVEHVIQVTRYQKYEHCTPPGASAMICVCSQGETARLRAI